MRAALVCVLAAALLAAAPAVAQAFTSPRALTRVDPQSVLFGDRVVAQLDVLVDTHVADPARIRADIPLGVWAQLGSTAVETTQAGGVGRRRYTIVLTCRVAECVPKAASAVVPLPPAQVTVVNRDGSSHTSTVTWPSILVAARVPKPSTSSPPFRLQVTPPQARPRFSVATATWILAVTAALLAAAAVALVGGEARRRRAPATAAPRSRLARALTLARQAETRPAPDRRRALDLLARAAGTRDEELAGEIASAAWTPTEPAPDRIADLVRRAEQLPDRDDTGDAR